MNNIAIELLTDRPVAYHPILAKSCGGVAAALFLSQLLYWTGRGKLADGWVWKSADDMEDETGLTRNEQETARKKLKALGILEEKLKGVPATLHYRVDFDALEKALQLVEKCQSSLAKSDKLDSGISPNLVGEKRQTIHRLSKTTPDTTASGEETLTEFFGERTEPLPEPRKPVDLRSEQSRQEYADHLQEQRRAKAINEPWRVLYEWVSAGRDGIERDTLRHVVHAFVTAGIPEPQSDKVRTAWRAALITVYQEAGGNFAVIERAAKEIAAEDPKFWPPHKWGQAIINVKSKKQSAGSGWQLPGGSTLYTEA